MAQNGITYEGRVINNERMPIQHSQTTSGMHIVRVTLAENHSTKLGRAKKDPSAEMKKFVQIALDRDPSKTDDDYITTTTTWHKVTIMGDKAEIIAQDPNFNHGGLFKISDASYEEEAAWVTKDGVQRAGRPETIGDKKGAIAVIERGGIVFGPKDPLPPIWDGISEVAKAGGNGGGQAREYGEDEGF